MAATRAVSVVRVCTYNVLSSSLSPKWYFRHCSPENLDPENRLQKVFQKLDEEVKESAIFCLQEVSLAWAGSLHQFFQERDYHLVLRLYGKPFNGYMGVGLAFPNKKYKSQEISIDRLADTKHWPPAPSHPWGRLGDLMTSLGGMAQATWRKLTGMLWRYQEPIDAYSYSKHRDNGIIFARLQCTDTNTVFCVSTYHMPCAFFAPAVMVMHTALAVQYVQIKAGPYPAILAGDFNFKPGDSCYQLVTTGDLEPNHPDYPLIPKYDMWRPEIKRHMKSAYKEAHGCEPDFTNHARIKNQPPFIDTLDYVFTTDDVYIDEVPALPHRKDVKGPLPNATEPSDHIMLTAQLKLFGKWIDDSSGPKEEWGPVDGKGWD